jgi:hypothetical protein
MDVGSLLQKACGSPLVGTGARRQSIPTHGWFQEWGLRSNDERTVSAGPHDVYVLRAFERLVL